MAKEKRYDDDASDNRGIVYFPDCKGCVFADPGNKITPGYTKSRCHIYPQMKPIELMMGGECEYYDEAAE